MQAEHKYGMSTKGKTPWITYNDEDLADSGFCIKFLNKKFSEFSPGFGHIWEKVVRGAEPATRTMKQAALLYLSVQRAGVGYSV